MRLSWQEIRARAAQFADDWKDARYERGETQTFYNEFFEVFGASRRRVATYEEPVKRLGDRRGYVDLFWKGVLLVEQKSAGRDLKLAKEQALGYFPDLKDYELPRYILVSDFQQFELYDLEQPGAAIRFPLRLLPENVEHFAFIIGVEKRAFRDEDPANIKASELMGSLHDALKDSGYRGHHLERFLVRVLFCLFADDTGIFERGSFTDLIRQRTREDGSDTGSWLARLFDVLDTPEAEREEHLDGDLSAFPYVNGDLFRDRLRIPSFNAIMRGLLLEACDFDWTPVSPAIFGSLFQSVMEARERRAQGAHYTTEKNILKVIQPLFLDDLRAELDQLKQRRDTGRRQALEAFHEKLGSLKFFDPACGCGNFLVIAYRELRLLEIEVLKLLRREERGLRIAAVFSRVDVDQFYGIEIGEFPARIAEVALWMMDHIMNNRLTVEFGSPFLRIPLKKSPHIHYADALEIDWTTVLPSDECSYILGNPPFGGAKYQSDKQRQQVRRIARLGGSGGTLDYVAAWYIKAGEYLSARVSLPSAGSLSSRAQHELPPAKGHAQSRDLLSAQSPEQIMPAGASLAASSRSFDSGNGFASESTPSAQDDTGKRVAHPPSLPPRIGFVGTNSITQGEQVAQLWPVLFGRCGLEISFAHRTFAWGSDARGKAHVHVIIIGLTRRDDEPQVKRLFTYDDIKGDPTESRHAALTPYLFDAAALADRHLVVEETSEPLCGQPKLIMGSQPIENGNYIFGEEEREEFLKAEPAAHRYMRPFIGAEEFINGAKRWILYLDGASPKELRAMPEVMKRIAAVKEYRRRSKRKSTLQLADTPTKFCVTVVPSTPFMVIPEVSSERRDYIPIGWLEPPIIPSNKLRLLEGADLFHFGILTSRMHMAWLRYIGGRLESRFQYSIGVVYNPFPWPEAHDRQRARIRDLAQQILDARARFPEASMADLYDSDVMPAELFRAHRDLDAAVDRLYRSEPFAGDRQRVEHLFARYERLVTPLLPSEKKKRRRR
jgi:hypothetical protein